MSRIGAALAGAALLVFGADARSAVEAAGAFDAPLRVRNESPAAHLYGLPRPLGAVLPTGARELVLSVTHANNFTAGTGARATAVFDGTTTISSLSLRQAAGTDLEWGVEVPGVYHSGGFTDRIIDAWHDLFGLPEGGRDIAPRNRLDYRIDYLGVEQVAVTESGGHLGDARAWVGYGFYQSAGRRAALRGQVKLPTGRVRHLSGSEGTDLSVALELVDQRWLAPLGVTVTLMGAVTRLGDGELAAAAQREWVASGHVGLHAPVWRNLSVHVQLDAHSDVLATSVPQVASRAVQGTLGGRVALPWSLWLDLAVTEDLTGKSAPDVVFHTMLTWQF